MVYKDGSIPKLKYKGAGIIWNMDFSFTVFAI